MKSIIYIFFLLVTCTDSMAQCPIYGDRTRLRIIDSLKNRNFVGNIDNSVTLENILTFTGDDTQEYSSDQYVNLEGYVVLVKYGGLESCQCHSKNKKDLDIHIELGLTPKAKGREAMIVEINRYTRKDHPEYSLINLKKLVGKKVSVEGFMMFDKEHIGGSVNTSKNPNARSVFRRTAWEVHPLMSINEIANNY